MLNKNKANTEELILLLIMTMVVREQQFLQMENKSLSMSSVLVESVKTPIKGICRQVMFQ